MIDKIEQTLKDIKNLKLDLADFSCAELGDDGVQFIVEAI